MTAPTMDLYTFNCKSYDDINILLPYLLRQLQLHLSQAQKHDAWHSYKPTIASTSNAITYTTITTPNSNIIITQSFNTSTFIIRNFGNYPTLHLLWNFREWVIMMQIWEIWQQHHGINTHLNLSHENTNNEFEHI